MNQVSQGVLRTVRVRRQWNDPRVATYRLQDIEGIHWDMTSGGVQAPAPQPVLHGYVSCQRMLEGEVVHSGTHGDCPHKIKVCVVKIDNDPSVLATLCAKAGPKPARTRCHAKMIRSGKPCGKCAVW